MDNSVNSISAIWKSTEKKSVEECAGIALNFLLLLKNFDNSLFEKWYQKGNSKKQALENEVDVNVEYLRNDLIKNWDKKFPDLGSRIAYWTGHNEGKSGQVSLKLGAYGNKSFNKNSCVIDLPYESNSVVNKTKTQELIELMSKYWSPDRILVNGEEI